MNEPIRFYFDYESPNAYLAWLELPKLAAKHGRAIELAPILYAGLLDAHGQLGPGEIHAKGRWMWKNLIRKAADLGIPLRPPAFLPFNPLLALRLSILPLPAADRDRLIDALFRAVWARRLHVSEEPVVAGVLEELGMPAAEMIARAKSPAVKQLLREATDDAVKRGVFGVPSMEVDGELFWGYDDFPFLDRFLAGDDVPDPAEWGEWRSAPPTPSSMRGRFRKNTS
jgi:2-hydroxychromene-2-carboxylate isomerase